MDYLRLRGAYGAPLESHHLVTKSYFYFPGLSFNFQKNKQYMKFYFLMVFCVMMINANAQDSTFKELTGRYKFPAGSVIDEANVSVENAALTMSSSAGTSTLERIKGDTFNVVSFNGICIFKRDDAKKINGVHVDASGYILEGVKDAAAVGIAAGDFSALTEQQLQLIKESEAPRYIRRIRVLGSIVP
jgi:hypothetical protein